MSSAGIATRDGVTVVGHPLILHKLSIMRKKDTSTSKFRQLLQRNLAAAPTR